MYFSSGIRSALQQTGLWSFLGIAAIAGYAALGNGIPLLETEKSAPRANVDVTRGLVAISADRSGHFAVPALINGAHVDMMADTGATAVILTYKDAMRLGIDLKALRFDVPVRTANGTSHTAQVNLDEVSVGNISVRDVRALISPPDVLNVNLLGMSFIKKLRSFELKGRQLILHQ